MNTKFEEGLRLPAASSVKRIKNSLLLPDDGQVPKRCKNNGTGSDVMCSAMGMGVSTRILFTNEYHLLKFIIVTMDSSMHRLLCLKCYGCYGCYGCEGMQL